MVFRVVAFLHINALLLALSTGSAISAEPALRFTPKQLASQESIARLLNVEPQSLRGQCGVDSLYLYLKTLNRPISLEEVRNVVEVTDRGSSLSDLQGGASRLAFSLDIVRADSSTLDAIPLPAIAHLEPNTVVGADAHYVLLVKVGPTKVCYVDPNAGKVDYPRADFMRWASGYFLVRRLSFFRPTSILGFAALGAGMIGIASCLRRRLHPQHAGSAANAVQQGLIVLFLSVSSTVGCADTPPATTTELPVATPATPAASTMWKPSIDIAGNSTDVYLGLLLKDSAANKVFHLKNITDKPIVFTVGKPTCGCLTASFSGTGTLPPQEVADLTLALRTSVDGGAMEASVAVGVTGTKEMYQFSVSGLIQGLRGERYIVRPTMYKKGVFPPLRLVLYAETAGTSFELTSITTQPADKSAGSVGLSATVSAATIGQPGTLVSRGYQREIEVPVSVTPAKEVRSGDFLISYRLNGEPKESRVEFVALAAE